jgi:hypothetical protein
MFPVIHGKEDTSGRFGSLDPFEAFDRGHERLFTQDVQACSARFLCQIGMRVGRCADIHKIESVAQDGRLYVGIDRDSRNELSRQSRPFTVRLHNNIDPEMLVLPEGRQVSLESDISKTDECSAQDPTFLALVTHYVSPVTVITC